MSIGHTFIPAHTSHKFYKTDFCKNNYPFCPDFILDNEIILLRFLLFLADELYSAIYSILDNYCIYNSESLNVYNVCIEMRIYNIFLATVN